MEFLYGKSVCAELTGGFVSLYITRSSNTKSRYGKSVCEKADLEDLLPYISRGDRTQSWNA